MNKKHIVILLLIIACLIAFGRIAGNDFILFDDQAYVTENYNIQQGINFQTLQWAMTTTYFSYWHPLTWISHMLDWTLFGNNAGGHHIVSLLFHIGAVIFLFLFLLKATGQLWPSAFAAAFFALHPLRVESVAWASERKDVLSMFFGMASIYAYAFYAEKGKISRYLICLVLFALSLMSKPMLVTLPFVLLLLDVWPLKRLNFPDSIGGTFRAAQRLVIEKIPFFVLTFAASILTFWAQNKEGIVAHIENLPFLTRVANALIAMTTYLGKTFWPNNLAVYYPYETMLPLWKIIISVAIIICITLVAIYYLRKIPFLFVGWFWFLGTLVPVIGLVQVGGQSMADRYTYLPSVGIAVMLAWGISLLLKNEIIRKKFLWPASLAVLCALVILTYRQCGLWENSKMLFHHALKVTKNNGKMNNNLAVYYFQKGKMDEAIYYYSQAIQFNPKNSSYHNNRGDAYARGAHYQKALIDFNNAIRLNPDYAEAYYNRGLTYDKTGQYQPAVADYNKAISLKKDFINAFINRGIIYAKAGRYQTAIEDFSKAIAMKPDYVPAYSNRAIAYFSQGQNIAGCADAKKACELGSCATLNAARKKGLCP